MNPFSLAPLYSSPFCVLCFALAPVRYWGTVGGHRCQPKQARSDVTSSAEIDELLARERRLMMPWSGCTPRWSRRTCPWNAWCTIAVFSTKPLDRWRHHSASARAGGGQLASSTPSGRWPESYGWQQQQQQQHNPDGNMAPGGAGGGRVPDPLRRRRVPMLVAATAAQAW